MDSRDHRAALGDPDGEVAIAYRVKERLRDFSATADPDAARALLQQLKAHRLSRAMPPEIHRFGRAALVLTRSATTIAAVSSGHPSSEIFLPALTCFLLGLAFNVVRPIATLRA